VAAAGLLGGTGSDGSAPAVDAFAGAFRINAAPVVRLAADDGSERSVAVPLPSPGTVAAPATPGVLADGTAFIDVGGRSVAFRLAPPPDVDRAARAAAGHVRGGGPRTVEAPMPGSVVRVHVAVGDPVDGGTPLVTLEAMKMEHVVAAPGPGRVTEIAVRPGAQVGRGDQLATIDDAALPLPIEEAR
jgi:biotin carboxyl carrier protein